MTNQEILDNAPEDANEIEHVGFAGVNYMFNPFKPNRSLADIKRIVELELELKIIKNPQFYMCEVGEVSYFCCNHCGFNTRLFKDRDEHAKSCVKRQKFLKGGE